MSSERPAASTSASTVGTTNVGGSNATTALQSQSQQPTSTATQTTNSTSKPHHQESPLYQKIMSRLSELPDSVLLRNYVSNPGNLQALTGKFSAETKSGSNNGSGSTRTFTSNIDENLKMTGQVNGK